MRAWRLRGNSMALYAAFLALVGLPLLALAIDVSHAWFTRLQLIDSVEAACAAFSDNLDLAAYQENGAIRLKPAAWGDGHRFFHESAPPGALLTAMYVRLDPEYHDTLVTTCSARVSVKPMIALGIGSFEFTHTTSGKAKFGSPANWGRK